MTFSYAEMTRRNIGFISASDQAALLSGSVFICGVGGMGGAAAQSLARAGVGRFTLADVDQFEISNFNRQVFANVNTVGCSKADATREAIAAINPQALVSTVGGDWTLKLDDILAANKVVINGMDDIAAGISLYRKARDHGATVIDAYTSPLPSVTVVTPGDPRPEERLGFPSCGRDTASLSEADIGACREAEVLYVVAESSSAKHIDLEVAAELLAGKRARPSFAPMVILTGNLMTFEAINCLLGRRSVVDYRGIFLNPWTFDMERPRNRLVRWARLRIARRLMRSLMAS